MEWRRTEVISDGGRPMAAAAAPRVASTWARSMRPAPTKWPAKKAARLRALLRSPEDEEIRRAAARDRAVMAPRSSPGAALAGLMYVDGDCRACCLTRSHDAAMTRMTQTG